MRGAVRPPPLSLAELSELSGRAVPACCETEEGRLRFTAGIGVGAWAHYHRVPYVDSLYC